MHIVLWDSRRLDVSKDFAGGFGVGEYPGSAGPRDWLIRWFFRRDRRPVALLFAHLSAVFAQLGHRVQYVVDRMPQEADLYVFNPSLASLALEVRVMARLLARWPMTHVLVVGTVASALPEAFDGLGVTVIRGDAEQLLWRLDEALARRGQIVPLGILEDLDRLPLPDWSPLEPRRFRMGLDFWRFPTALIQASRGCAFGCDYCPYLVADHATRLRDPAAVIDEIRNGIRRWGFRSFKFRDPLFGAARNRMFQLAESIDRLPQRIQFSIETRPDLLPAETLRVLQRVGLTTVTVGIETPDDALLDRHHRVTIDRDRQREFFATCRSLGIRTVAGFLIGFPEDTEETIRRVRDYAISLRPTFANFNVVTPYPGTPFFDRMLPQIKTPDFSRFTGYTPVLRYEHLASDRVESLLLNCFRRFYFRWQYLRDNAHWLWRCY